MPQTTPAWRKDASEEELRSRATEMRHEFAEDSWGERGTETFDAAKRAFIEEIEDIDMQLTLRGLSVMPRTAPQGALGAPGPQYRSAGEAVVADEQFRAWAKANAGRSHITESPTIEVSSLRALVSTGAGGVDSLLTPMAPTVRGVDRNRYVMRDLLTVIPTQQSAISYVRELNSAANATAAKTVAEGAAKPEATIEFVSATAPISVIAVWVPVTNQALDDVNEMRAYIDSRLRYMLELREDEQILAGDGTGSNLSGILADPNIQTQATAGAGEYAQTIGKAIAKIEAVNGYPSGVVMNTGTAWDMFIHRAAGGAGTFDAGTPFSDIPLNVWGLPVVRTNALAPNKALVGDFKQGAALYDRQQVSVRVFEQHADYAIYNKSVVLAEERVGLAIWRPDHFVLATTS